MLKRKSVVKAICAAALICLAAAVTLVFMGFTRPAHPVLAETAPTAEETPEAPETSEGGELVTETPNDTLTTGEDGSDDGEEEEKFDKKSLILALIGMGASAVIVAVIVLENTNILKKNGKRGGFSKLTTQQLTESALMVAIATVCSLVKIDMPYGGGVTIVSMLPIILISHRYGWSWGITTAFVYSVIQLLFGLDNVHYATNVFMAFGVIFLDYIVAYTVIGLSGVFGRNRKAVAIGISVTFFLRFLCHYVTGVWIWGGWMPDTYLGLRMVTPWIYSGIYNGIYMLAEYVLTMIVAMLIYKPLQQYFEGPKPIEQQANVQKAK